MLQTWGNDMLKTQITILMALTAIAARADVQSISSAKIIYGIDNRIETFESSSRDQSLASSTAGMIETSKLVEIGEKYMLPPKNIQDSMGLCSDQRFSDQPTSVICSGFLVGPNLLVTAGHCVTSQERCEEVSFIFDYALKETTKKADILIDKKNVYKCSKVIEAKLENIGSDKRDYALVKLDRVVEARSSLEVRTSGIINEKEELVIIGHPSGLPQKVSDGAKVFENDSEKSYFQTNLDSFGGNSGSAVFNNKTGVVEGILVRGARDYVNDSVKQCIVVYEAPDEIDGIPGLGESVSRITDIPSLKYQSSLMLAAEAGDIDKLKDLKAKAVSLDMTNRELNTALHIAAKTGDIEIVKYLISEGVDLNQQNLMGETALHIAAFENSKSVIYSLVEAGADVLVKDKFGVYPSERTNYLAFKVRSYLRKKQDQEYRRRQ